MIEYLPWDSSFFGFKTGMTTIHNPEEIEIIKQKFNQSDYKLLYLFDHNTSDTIVDLLKDNKIPLIDTKLTYTKCDFRHNSSIKIRKIDELSNKLVDLGLQSGIYSRFYRDEQLQKYFEPMYTKWVEKSITGEMANIILGTYNNGHLSGMLTIKAHNNSAKIGLIAVDRDHRGTGAGRSLLEAAEKWCLENRLSELIVSTQQINSNACNFYTNNEFTLKNSVHIFHLWK